MSALNALAFLKAVVFGMRKKKGSGVKMDQIKTTKDHNYQQLARKDLLWYICVTLDTSQLLMSALNAEAFRKSPLKAVVFGRRKKKGSDVKMDQIKTTKDHNTINNWQGKTYFVPRSSHVTRPSCRCLG
tara:strand:+ start:120 stop:506 length:387 start_codon:yes stop_codon:yes gene_type:complete